jgi:nitrilase
VAAVQAAPVFLDLPATLDKVDALVAEAVAGGASLVVFPEAFVPTYPDWVWRTPAWSEAASDLQQRLHENAVELPGPAADRLGDIAARHGVLLVVGVNEREGGTLYNTIAYLSSDGELLGRHRKLVPTGGERLVWGAGDGSGLTVHDTPLGRIGGLICWENYMPLARAALYAGGVEIYLAPTWDNSSVWVPTLRHIAKEGRTFVIGVNSILRGSDVPEAVPHRAELYGGDDDWMSRGNTAIVDPFGDLLAGPLVEEAGIVFADLDLSLIDRARAQFDVVGHYARPEVFALRVDTTERPAGGISSA